MPSAQELKVLDGTASGGSSGDGVVECCVGRRRFSVFIDTEGASLAARSAGLG